MIRQCVRLTFAALCLTAASSAAERVTITGQVVTAAGQPVDHATVIVYSAGVKQGYSTYCPTCYPDCGKRTFSDAKGAFRVDGLNPDLRFRLLVVQEGYRPAFVPGIDAAAPAKAVLQPRAPVADPARVVLGRVVDPTGRPLRDAIVEAQGVALPNGARIFGSPDGLEPLAVTNAKGDFEIAYGQPATSMVLLAEARGMAPKKLLAVPTGKDRQTIVLNDGAMVRGRVMQRGKPVSGVEMGLYSTNHYNGNGYEEIRVGTNEDGTFAFTNVSTGIDWYLYAKMDSISSRGAMQMVKVSTRKDLEEIDAGDLEIVPGHRVRGRVVLSDGRPVAPGMRVLLTPGCDNCGREVPMDVGSRIIQSRSVGWRDSQTVVLGPDGQFEFTGLSGGPYQVMAAVKGYGLSAGYSLLRPLDAVDEEAWKRTSEFSNRRLRESSIIEIRVDKDVDGIEMKLEPAAGRR
jgi:hypothetical protein